VVCEVDQQAGARKWDDAWLLWHSDSINCNILV